MNALGMPTTNIMRGLRQFINSMLLAMFSSLLSPVSAATPKCTIEADTFVGNAKLGWFHIAPWTQRGACIRKNIDGCYPTLLAVLDNVIELRKAEYSGAAGLLALLPTIGALFGAPTNEVWILMNILPFGGALAIVLSFGGAILPVHVEDYERVTKKRNIAIGTSFLSFREDDPTTFPKKLELLDDKVRDRVALDKSMRPGKGMITVGLVGMVLLVGSSQFAIAVVQYGGIILWNCRFHWWMHLWYFLVTLTAIMENITQLPFLKQHKLYVSSVPYELDISGGESLLTGVHGRTESEPDSEPKHVGLALKQLHTMPAARVVFLGSTQFTKSRNAVLVMVSIVGTNSRKRASFSRLLSKSASIAVFVAGTAMFASVTLVALPVAVLVVTLVLGAGVFGRAIAGWLVQTVSETEPMIHVIVKDEDEANHAVSRILSLKLEHEEKVQVEIGGHIFVDGRRVATRSKWWVAICGVLANPYDLRRANNNPLAAVEPPEGLSV